MSSIENDSPNHKPATAVSRREMLRLAGAGVVAGVVLGANATPSAADVRDLTLTDINLLNFALNLEYFEAEFYTYAVSGQGIESVGIGMDGQGQQGPTTGGQRVNFADPILRAVAEELAFDEQQHVRLLRRVLGDQAIAKPAINLNGLGFGFGSEEEYLRLARISEDTGTTAYVGANDKLSRHLQTTAAGILADEAYHMGNVRLMIAQRNITTQAVDAKDILPPPSGKRFFYADNLALTPARTVLEVTPIVRPFFPQGMNTARR